MLQAESVAWAESCDLTWAGAAEGFQKLSEGNEEQDLWIMQKKTWDLQVVGSKAHPNLSPVKGTKVSLKCLSDFALHLHVATSVLCCSQSYWWHTLENRTWLCFTVFRKRVSQWPATGQVLRSKQGITSWTLALITTATVVMWNCTFR